MTTFLHLEALTFSGVLVMTTYSTERYQHLHGLSGGAFRSPHYHRMFCRFVDPSMTMGAYNKPRSRSVTTTDLNRAANLLTAAMPTPRIYL
jgi:hypothetical protein